MSELEPKRKKQRSEEITEEEVNGTSGRFSNLKNFEIIRILNNGGDKCSIAIEGTFKGLEGKAIVQLQKTPFNEDKLPEIFSSDSSLRKLFENDIFHNLMFSIPSNLNELKSLVIYPAEEKHFKKYQRQYSSFIFETPEIYESVTLPYIVSASYSKQWIYNILEHKTEVERIVYEDLDPVTGFIMVPDMKWTGEQVEDLYLQAIVMDRTVTCVRGLNANHLGLLENIYNKGTNAIKEKYGVPAHKLRVYFHYQPSYYHLHVHFSALSFDAPGTWAGKAILLQDVLSNLRLDSEFYKKACLSYTLKDNHPLMDKLKEYGYFKQTTN